MESRKLHITLHSCKDLYEVKFFGTMNPYAFIWISGDDNQSNPRQTETAIRGGSSPVWDCRMEFNVASSMNKNCTLFCEIKHAGAWFDREIGHMEVSFGDLLAGDGSDERVSYPVKNFSGEVHGEIILSHKFSGGPEKKVEAKKENGMRKRIVEKMVNQVVTKAISVAVAVVIDNIFS